MLKFEDPRLLGPRGGPRMALVSDVDELVEAPAPISCSKTHY